MSNYLEREELEHLQNFVVDVLINFKESSNCCMNFPVIPTQEELRSLVHYLAEKHELLSRVHFVNGIANVKIYKSICPSYANLHLSCFNLMDTSRLLVNGYLEKNPISVSDHMKMSPIYFRPNDTKPTVSPIKLIDQVNGTATKYSFDSNKISAKLIDQHRNEIVKYVTENRLIIFRSRSRVGKSRNIPRYLMESYNEREIGCKIVSTQIHEICAFNNWQLLSNDIHSMNDQLRSHPPLVGCQTSSLNNCSDSTRIIFTTTKYFLRSLMGAGGKDVLRKMTHLIIDDIQVNDPFILMLLHEIKESFDLYQSLKLVLISSSQMQNCHPFIELFGGGIVVKLDYDYQDYICTYSMDNILSFMRVPTENSSPYHKELLQPIIDETLMLYYKSGQNSVFNDFLYLVDGENVSVDVQHSETKIIALKCALLHSNFDHLVALLNRHAKIDISDEAMAKLKEFSILAGKLESYQYIEKLRNQSVSTKLLEYRKYRWNCHEAGIDYNLITRLLAYLSFQLHDNTLVFLPAYDDLLKLKFHILKAEISGIFGAEIEIHLVHPNMDIFALQDVYKTTEKFKLILATDLAESVIAFNNISAVIDTGLEWQEFYVPETSLIDKRLVWISKVKRDMRQKVVGNKPVGFYYYLFTDEEYKTFPNETPIVDRMNLDTVALYGKILRPYTSTLDYLKLLSSNVPLENVRETIEMLTSINVFNTNEDITWLGVHLVDIPIKLSSAKMLIYANILQCFDPILTIVSFLEFENIFELPRLKTSLGAEYRYRMKKQTFAMSDGSYCDHFIYVNLYKNWKETVGRNGCTQGNNCYPLVDEKNFVVNEIMKNVDKLRSKIASTIQLLPFLTKKMGNEVVNKNSNNWPMVKICIACGTYPNICQMDSVMNLVKSREGPQVFISPSSVLRNLILSTLSEHIPHFPSKWIVYNRATEAGKFIQISACSLINPLSLALLCGDMQINEHNVVKINTQDYQHEIPNCYVGGSIIFIDRWMELIANELDVNLVMHLRLQFYHIFLKILKDCKLSNALTIGCQSYNECVTAIKNLLIAEEIKYGFRQLLTYSTGPMVVPFAWVKPIMHSGASLSENALKNFGAKPKSNNIRSFHVLVVPTRESMNEIFFGGGSIYIYNKTMYMELLTSIQQNPFQDIYIFIFNVNEKIFMNASKVIWRKEQLSLLECVRNDVTFVYFEFLCTKYEVFPRITPDYFKRNHKLKYQLATDMLNKMLNTEYSCFK